MPKLLTRGSSNPKTRKTINGKPIRNAILHLAPANVASARQSVCPWATEGCKAGCLNTSGRGQMVGDAYRKHPIHSARIRRTLYFLRHRLAFVDKLKGEIATLERTANKRGEQAAVRLNGTSDVPWEAMRDSSGRTLMESFPSVIFYDYTKSAHRAAKAVVNAQWPANYHLTFSRSEVTPDEQVKAFTDIGINVAIVFKSTIPSTYLGKPVIDGTEHDFRHLDGKGVIVGLKALGRAKRDASGFVVEVA